MLRKLEKKKENQRRNGTHSRVWGEEESENDSSDDEKFKNKNETRKKNWANSTTERRWRWKANGIRETTPRRDRVGLYQHTRSAVFFLLLTLSLTNWVFWSEWNYVNEEKGKVFFLRLFFSFFAHMCILFCIQVIILGGGKWLFNLDKCAFKWILYFHFLLEESLESERVRRTRLTRLE